MVMQPDGYGVVGRESELVQFVPKKVPLEPLLRLYKNTLI